MTSNPYAQTDFGPDYYPEQRTSVLAILSLVFSLICCLPGTGVVGIVLGIAAIVAIASAQGRLAGRGMAIAGLIIGVFTTVLWLAVGFGMMSFAGSLNIYGESIEDMQAGRPADARLVLAPSADTAVTDERLVAFGQQITDEWGAYTGMPGGVFDWFGAYGEVGPRIGATQPAIQAVYRDDAIPVPVRFDRGSTVLWVVIAPGTAPGQAGSVRNYGFVDRSGQVVWLIDPPQPGTGAPAPAPAPAPPAAGDEAPAPEPASEPETGPETGPAGDEGGA